MARSQWLQVCALTVGAFVYSASAQAQSTTTRLPGNQPPPHTAPGQSSSRETQTVDISPPADDYTHQGGDTSDVGEFHQWNPLRAMKDVEVGDFYFKKKNYRAAESRYAGALQWKPNDAIATFRLANAEEKLGKAADALKYYQEYLKILPEGDYADDCKKAIARLEK